MWVFFLLSVTLRRPQWSVLNDFKLTFNSNRFWIWKERRMTTQAKAVWGWSWRKETKWEFKSGLDEMLWGGEKKTKKYSNDHGIFEWLDFVSASPSFDEKCRESEDWRGKSLNQRFERVALEVEGFDVIDEWFLIIVVRVSIKIQWGLWEMEAETGKGANYGGDSMRCKKCWWLHSENFWVFLRFDVAQGKLLLKVQKGNLNERLEHSFQESQAVRQCLELMRLTITQASGCHCI